MTRRDWPIIVGGCHRSGTSLLRRLLNAHSRIHCGPEVKFFRDFYGDYPDDPLWHLRFLSTARSLVPEDEVLEVVGTAFVELHERAAARAGKARWADKTPENVRHLAQWQRLLGDAWLFVHLVRNPLDTIASIKAVGFPRTFPPDLDGRIAFYRQYTLAGVDFGRAHPARYYRLAYEELVCRPEDTLASLMSWLGERLDMAQFSFNQMPQGAGVEDPNVAKTARIHAASVGRWASVLTPEEAAAIRTSTDDVWSALGHESAMAVER